MKIQIKSEDLEINEKLQQLVDTKIAQGLDKYLKNFNEDLKLMTIRIYERTRWGYKVNASMWLPKKSHIFAEEVHEDLTIAFTNLKKELVRQIKEYKDLITRKRNVN